MAVTDSDKTPVMMRDFWERFQLRTVIKIVATQCVTAFIVIALLAISGAVDILSPLFWLTMGIMLIILVGVNYVMYRHITGPFYDLVQAVVHVSGENSVKTPPNPNTHSYQEDGFKEILQTVYELAITDAPAQQTSEPIDSTVTKGLDQTKTGIVLINSEKQIIYNNKKSPVHITTKGDKTLDLQFMDNESLYDWIENCQKKSVSSERIWTRIPDRQSGEKGRRIYDVIASFQKGAAAETVVTLVDQTATYAPEDDDLDFISFAAHELRGPITVIRGYLNVLEDEITEKLEDDQVELLHRLVVSSNRLSSYVNNILNASKFDRRHFQVHLKEDSLSNIYETIRDDMELRASSQNRLLIVNFTSDTPTVAADANSVGEVMSNLIDNAIKYSNEGGQIIVTAERVGNFVEVAVQDRGIGIPANVIPHLFHKFYRSHRSRETVAGTGIGLYICKAIVESHGGHVTARSTERQGSTFTFSLPVYDTVADKLQSGDNNQQLLEHGGGWIKNHSMYRG